MNSIVFVAMVVNYRNAITVIDLALLPHRQRSTFCSQSGFSIAATRQIQFLRMGPLRSRHPNDCYMGPARRSSHAIEKTAVEAAVFLDHSRVQIGKTGKAKFCTAARHTDTRLCCLISLERFYVSSVSGFRPLRHVGRTLRISCRPQRSLTRPALTLAFHEETPRAWVRSTMHVSAMFVQEKDGRGRH